MKAIILLELDDGWLDINNFNIDELLADITLYHDLSLKRQCDYRQRIYRCFNRLKHMPQKEDIIEKLEIRCSDDELDIRAALAKGYQFGWNNCIDELLKDVENS